MIELPLQEVVELLQARLQGPVPETAVLPPVSIDTRTLQPGECFVAIRGSRFDGHDFIPQALERGASTVVHSSHLEGVPGKDDRVFIQVTDTTGALQVLAHYVRKKWGRSLVAISGSVGKTTTREFTVTLLQERFKVLQSPGNLNNEIGVPLSLLRLKADHEVAVLELGMNHPGEIRLLSRLCAPDVALLTNVSAVHLEFFADVDEIAAAKGEILEGLATEGRFFFNADDRRLCRLADAFGGRKISFALEAPADVRISDYHFEHLEKMSFTLQTAGERLEASVPFAGKHFLYNISAATAVALHFGLSREEIERAFPRLKIPPMRGQIFELSQGRGASITIWDDSYNSNPLALTAVLETIRQLTGFHRKIVALGDMLELGPRGPELHRQVGESIPACGADLLVTAGSNARQFGEGAREAGLAAAHIRHFEDAAEAGAFLSGTLRDGDFLLVKGSRGARMDRVIQVIKESTKN